jgi:ABC-type dipeptide/oligopeptide/nickel transport system permease subunit
VSEIDQSTRQLAATPSTGSRLAADEVALTHEHGLEIDGHSSQSPTLQAHRLFSADFLGRDSFSRVVYAIRTSERRLAAPQRC